MSILPNNVKKQVCYSTGSSSATIQKGGKKTAGADSEAGTQDQFSPFCLRLLPPAGLRGADYLGQKHADKLSLVRTFPSVATSFQPQMDGKHTEGKEQSGVCLWGEFHEQQGGRRRTRRQSS